MDKEETAVWIPVRERKRLLAQGGKRALAKEIEKRRKAGISGFSGIRETKPSLLVTHLGAADKREPQDDAQVRRAEEKAILQAAMSRPLDLGGGSGANNTSSANNASGANNASSSANNASAAGTAVSASVGSRANVQTLPSDWTPPAHMKSFSEKELSLLRKAYHIDVEGEQVPPLCIRFVDMKLPAALCDILEERGMSAPTAIQMQGLPVALSRRDMIGIAFTGSGKTMAFSIPAIMHSLRAEMILPLERGEGPLVVMLSPSRELARQTHGIVQGLCKEMHRRDCSLSSLRVALCMGGTKVQEVMECVNQGVHIVVATPGRLNGMLREKRFSLTQCTLLVMDEADRLVDIGFEEDIRMLLSFFNTSQRSSSASEPNAHTTEKSEPNAHTSEKSEPNAHTTDNPRRHVRQSLLFSATMPIKVKEFARTALNAPIIVNVGRAGAANLDVVQELVFFVEKTSRMVALLDALAKTPPPVMIFAENTDDVDDIQEYLLLKGVKAASIHGGKPQNERNKAIDDFLGRKRDVLVATDIASKGLDFADVQHVINYDMPDEIEFYVHRIGRTGRCGKTGLATTFITPKTSKTTLLDLKWLLQEANQVVPEILQELKDEDAPEIGPHLDSAPQGCQVCGGLGHRITNCPKLDKDRAKLYGLGKGGPKFQA